jgi:hypothetical protein
MRTPGALLTIATFPATTLVFAYAAACGNGNRSAASADASVSKLDTGPPPMRVPYDGLAPPNAAHPTPVHAEFVTSPVRTDTMQLMFAAGEMQTSGEPFAQDFAGRNLYYYIAARYSGKPDQYWIPSGTGNGVVTIPVIDLFGFSTVVESYEYSKYNMNMVVSQSGAGVSLINGPLINALPGATPFDKLRARMETLIAATGSDITQFAVLPPPANNPRNDFGFPGLWPNMAPYQTFDVTMAPSREAAAICVPPDGGSPSLGYGGLALFGGHAVALYECDYNSIHLSNRGQAVHVIGPGILGYSTWKEALWAIDFTGRLHDAVANFVTSIGQEDMAQVGLSRNTVQGLGCPQGCQLVAGPNNSNGCPNGCQPGVYIGSAPLEGIWGLTMVEDMDNAAAWLTSSLATSDGKTLTGLPSTLDAIQYDYTSPLVWFPTTITVTEATAGASADAGAGAGVDAGAGSNAAADGGSAGDSAQSYPLVSSLSVLDATSHSVDLAALAQGYSLFFGMTDGRNVGVGQQIGMQIAFGGSPFASDDGLPDGENTPHDRALGVMRVAFVDLDRMHVEPATGVVVDTATVNGGTIMRGSTATTTSLGHVVVGLRHLLMGCNAAVTQYGAPDPDPTKDDDGILNSVPIHPAGAALNALPSFSARVRQVLTAQAAFVLNTLTSSDGTVHNGATVTNGHWTAMPDPASVESQSAALRVLSEAWLLTQDVIYQDRARAVAKTLLTAFWTDPARMFRQTAQGPDDIVMTPERFGWLQQGLRETYKWLWVPGDPLLDRSVLEDRIARVNKLYLNGWDDLNGDQHVDKPGECLDARLQLGEQALTGEIASDSNGHAIQQGPDVDSDCVLNISYTDAGSVLAGAVHFHAP